MPELCALCELIGSGGVQFIDGLLINVLTTMMTATKVKRIRPRIEFRAYYSITLGFYYCELRGTESSCYKLDQHQQFPRRHEETER